MDLLAVLRIALRRWYVVLVVGVLAGGAAAAVSSQVLVNYTVDSTVLVSSPFFTNGEDKTGYDLNPYSELDNTTAFLTAFVSSDDIRQAVASSGAKPDYLVTTSGSKPLIELKVEASSEDAALAGSPAT